MIYRRVFVPPRWSAFDIILRVFEIVLILFYVAISLVKIFECTPRAKIWDKKLPGTCTNVSAILNTSGLFNFITDVLILLVPVKSVWNLNMQRKRKIAVVAVFTVGLIAPIFSMIGFVVRLQDSGDPDATYNQPFVLLWGTAEVSTGNICISLPPIAVLFRHNRRRTSGSPHNGDSNARTQSCRRKQPLNRDKSDLYHDEYLKLREFSTDTVGVKTPPGVVTRIKGGAEYPLRQEGHHSIHGAATTTDTRDGVDELAPAANIMKTVRVEHSFV
ncbi:MAG: hypothetical protein M1830_003249 [Pleopsidium flavum]|nr:MAG: hypothetical protein M1830_003249 [Pleopsidium flavum]